jgi:D-3-phosphoglycerate dehydrogenase
MYRVLITDNISERGLALLNEADRITTEIVLRPQPDQLVEMIKDFDAVITRSSTVLDKAVFTAGNRLKVAARAGVGLDSIDLEAATAAGVMVMNTPDASTLATAEHAMALLLALARKIPSAHHSLASGEWARSRFVGTQLAGKVLGVVGLGRVGTQVVGRARAFGMNVVAFDPYVAEEAATEAGAELVDDLDELLAASDFVTLHTALIDSTRRMLGRHQFKTIKHGAHLINCARGELIDETALLAALESGRLAGAALDVFTQEPPASETLRRLITHPAVVVTPHLAGSTVEAQEDVGVQIARQVVDALTGSNLVNVVNLPFIQGVDYAASLPFLHLAEAVGSLQSQLIDGRIERIELAFEGDEMLSRVKPLTVALLKGLLTPVFEDRVNYVNAPVLAEERGIALAQVPVRNPSEYAHLLTCRVQSPKEARTISATLFAHHIARIVRIDDFLLDGAPEGRILVMRNHDIPGVIGKVGTLLGERGINIGEWRLGRSGPGGVAMSFINVDNEVSEEVMAELKALEPVIDARQVLL